MALSTDDVPMTTVGLAGCADRLDRVDMPKVHWRSVGVVLWRLVRQYTPSDHPYAVLQSPCSDIILLSRLSHLFKVLLLFQHIFS